MSQIHISLHINTKTQCIYLKKNVKQRHNDCAMSRKAETKKTHLLVYFTNNVISTPTENILIYFDSFSHTVVIRHLHPDTETISGFIIAFKITKNNILLFNIQTKSNIIQSIIKVAQHRHVQRSKAR